MHKTLCAFVVALFFHVTLQAQVAERAVVSGTLAIGSKQFALPPGEWTVVAASQRPNTIGGVDKAGAVRFVYLVQLDPSNRLIAAMSINASVASTTGIDGWNDEPCKRTDTLYRDTLDGNFKYPACLLINHQTNFWQGGVPADAFGAKIWNWYRDNKVDLPSTVIVTAYSKYFAGDYVIERAWLNPDVAGIAPAPPASWNSSLWHPALIKNEPERLAYIEAVKTWSQTLVTSSRASLMKGKTAGPLPALPGLETR
jgi:hypothetical protein